MENAAINAVNLGNAAVENMSIWGLFMQADLMVKSVMLLLVLASFWSWAIIFEKVIVLRRLNARTDDFENSFWSGDSLDTLYDRVGDRPTEPMGALFASAMKEWRRTASRGKKAGADMSAGLQQRIERVMQVTFGREMDALERYMGFLASVGSTAPFVGLFGTVWGIMNSFQNIAVSKSTSLAVVAPGIAEALFATALGLIAAIPAVVAYNKLSNDLNRYGARLEAFSGEFGTILSRQLDEGQG